MIVNNPKINNGIRLWIVLHQASTFNVNCQLTLLTMTLKFVFWENSNADLSLQTDNY